MPNTMTNPPPVDAEDHAPGSVQEKLELKLERHYEELRKAFIAQEFDRALEALSQFPESHRNEHIRNLERKCRELAGTQASMERAENCFSRGKYEEATHILGLISKGIRSEPVQRMLNRSETLSTTHESIFAARKILESYEYRQAMAVLETNIEEEKRGEDYHAIWNEANTKWIRLQELSGRLEAETMAVDQTPSIDGCDALITLLEELCELKPANEEYAQQLSEARTLYDMLDELVCVVESATQQFVEFNYQSVVDSLSPVEEKYRSDTMVELLVESEARVAQIAELREQIVASIVAEELTELAEQFEALNELRPGESQQLIGSLEREQCDQFLTCVATHCHQDASLIELLDLVLVALTESGLLELLVNGSGEFVERYPAASVVLPNRLTELLDDLANRSMSLRETVAALRIGEALLGDRSEELAGWEELVTALDIFDSAGNRRWTIWDRFVESGAVRRVNKAGRRLAEAAARVLVDDANRWNRLRTMSLGVLDADSGLVGRICVRMQRFLQTAVWPNGPLAPITRQRFGIFAGSAVGLGCIGFLSQAYLADRLGVDGTGSQIVVFSLAACWIALYRAICKLL